MNAKEAYTPGYTQNASNLMARRTASSHAAFLLPHLRESSRLLDCGCGPGSMSCDFARILSSGYVTGIDCEQSQIELAHNRARNQHLTNVSFEVGSIYELPFPDSSFEVVFAHAVFEHISSHDAALKEMFRVLAPGGLVAVRSPDWGGFIVVPDIPGLQTAMQHYADLQTANGGDIHIGRKLPGLLRAAGFDALTFSATYDCTLSPTIIAEYLALPLMESDAEALREWGGHPDAVFAQAWCEILGTRHA